MVQVCISRTDQADYFNKIITECSDHNIFMLVYMATVYVWLVKNTWLLYNIIWPFSYFLKPWWLVGWEQPSVLVGDVLYNVDGGESCEVHVCVVLVQWLWSSMIVWRGSKSIHSLCKIHTPYMASGVDNLTIRSIYNMYGEETNSAHRKLMTTPPDRNWMSLIENGTATVAVPDPGKPR